MSSSNIEVSFCIPTYNNFQSVFRLVSSILESDDLDIEVVVLDNGSTDETYSRLKEINDFRLAVYTNIENKGALFNMINVLDKGKGKFLVYCTDHDHVDTQKIATFKTFLVNNQNVSFGYSEYNSQAKVLFEIFSKGSEALNKLGYITRHPTGYFFKNEKLKSLDIVENFSNYEFVDLFPLEFIFAELSLMGDGVIYHDLLFTPETGERVVKHKSATTKGNSKTAFFSPECRLKLAVNFEKHLQSLPISNSDKKSLIKKIFFREFYAATFGFKNVMENEKLCIHYRMQRREISKSELLKIGYSFYKGYVEKVLKEKSKSRLGNIIFTNYLYAEPKKFLGFLYRVILK